MKNKLKVLVLGLFIVLLAGCYKMDVKMNINDDKSMDLEVIYAIDRNSLEGLSNKDTSGIDIENYKNLTKEGYTVENYESKTSDHDYQGVKITKKYANIDKLTTRKNKRTTLLGVSSNSIEEDGLFKKDKNKYTSNFDIDLTQNGETQTITEDLKEILDLKYEVTLPSEVIKTNATKVSDDKKTLTWELEYGKVNTIEFEFELKDEVSCTIIFVIIGSLVIIVVCFVILFKKKKIKVKKSTNKKSKSKK